MRAIAWAPVRLPVRLYASVCVCVIFSSLVSFSPCVCLCVGFCNRDSPLHPARVALPAAGGGPCISASANLCCAAGLWKCCAMCAPLVRYLYARRAEPKCMRARAQPVRRRRSFLLPCTWRRRRCSSSAPKESEERSPLRLHTPNRALGAVSNVHFPS